MAATRLLHECARHLACAPDATSCATTSCPRRVSCPRGFPLLPARASVPRRFGEPQPVRAESERWRPRRACDGRTTRRNQDRGHSGNRSVLHVAAGLPHRVSLGRAPRRKPPGDQRHTTANGTGRTRERRPHSPARHFALGSRPAFFALRSGLWIVTTGRWNAALDPPGQGCLPLATAITFPRPTCATAGRSLPLHGGHPTEPPRPASSPSMKIRASQ